MSVIPECLNNVLYNMCDEDRVASEISCSEESFLIKLFDVSEDEARDMDCTCNAVNVSCEYDTNTRTFTVHGSL